MNEKILVIHPAYNRSGSVTFQHFLKSKNVAFLNDFSKRAKLFRDPSKMINLKGKAPTVPAQILIRAFAQVPSVGCLTSTDV